MRLAELVRTASFRIAGFYAALFSGSVLVIFLIIYLAITGYAARQLSDAIEEDLATLQTEYRLGGLNNLVAEIVVRLDLRNDTPRYYLLEAADGRVLAGNAGQQPPHAGWTEFLAAGGGTEPDGGPGAAGHVMAKSVVLPDGSYLLVGRAASHLDELRHLLIQAFGWGMAATLVLAIGGAMLMSMVSLRRVEAITRATEEIMAGNLALRVPAGGTGDEFDRLAGQVNLMLDRIEDLMQGLRQVSSDIAHDLKTPLTRMRQRLEVARHTAREPAAFATTIDQAIGDCDQTLKTFDALLRIAQIESGTRRSGFQPVDLAALAASLVEIYQPVGEESGHHLSADLPAVAPILGDRELITQMLANLVENAFKHTPTGTAVHLTLTAEPAHWRLAVADNGPGVTEADRAQILRRFYRAEASRTTPGSGLGLSLVAAVAQLHDAPLAVEDNQPGLKIAMRFARAEGAVPAPSP